MNEDYLWDRTGEPDAEVQELEDVLGTLRYQPRPLGLPADVQASPRRRFVAALAIAATILLAVLATGLWLGFHRQQMSRPSEIANTTKEQKLNSSAPSATNGGDQKPIVSSGKRESAGIAANRDPAPRRNSARRNPTRTDTPPRQDEMTAAQRAEGEAGKEQVMLALRVASSKLNLAQRKTQGPPATNSIRNQHKLG